MPEHKDLTAANLHTVFRRVFADDVDRLADTSTYEAAEVNNAYALVLSNANSRPQVYLLTSTTGDWTAIDAGSVVQLANDAALAGFVPTIGPEQENRFVLVEDRSTQGPQLLFIKNGVVRNFVGLPATITIAANEVAGIPFAVGAGVDVNLAQAIAAGVRNEFPANTWDFTNFELTAPADGYVRTALTINFNVDAGTSMVVAFYLQRYDTGLAAWVDVSAVLAQEISPQTIPYQLASFTEVLVSEGEKYRIIVRHDDGARTLTVYRAESITNFVFSV